MSISSHKSLELAGNVFTICKPFFKRYQLNAFSYARIYPDGSRTELWSDALALEHTFFKKKYIVGAYTPNYFSEGERFAFLQEKVNGYPKILRERYTQQLIDQRDYFNHDHSFITINRELDFCEYFIYYAPVGAHSKINFYVNHLDILNNFATHFKHAAADLIEAADACRIPMPGYSLLCGNKVLPVLGVQENQILHSNQLTVRQQEVAALLLNGKVAREMGEILRISKRTVESHIEQIKLKTNCENKSELIGYLHSINTLKC